MRASILTPRGALRRLRRAPHRHRSAAAATRSSPGYPWPDGAAGCAAPPRVAGAARAGGYRAAGIPAPRRGKAPPPAVSAVATAAVDAVVAATAAVAAVVA